MWIWLQTEQSLDKDQELLLEEVLKAWFILGKLGGFNAANMQVQRHVDEVGLSISHLDYEPLEERGPGCLFHAMGEVEFKDTWARCWFDLGTSDELAIDVLINSLSVFSKECASHCSAAKMACVRAGVAMRLSV